MSDLMAMLKASLTDDCGMSHARRVVQCRFEAGFYPVQTMDADLRECLARALWKSVKAEPTGDFK